MGRLLACTLALAACESHGGIDVLPDLQDPPLCADGVQNLTESDVDCGGIDGCPPCAAGKKCRVDFDCAGGVRCGGGRCGGEPRDMAGWDMARPPWDLYGRDFAPGSVTGDPCLAAQECQGTAPHCIVNDLNLMWPDGYCSSTCDPAKNVNGLNADCPGQATCEGGLCLRACSARASCRQGYSCFFSGPIGACRPSASSQCNPVNCGVCPQQTCVRTGYDDVGQCRPACDPFVQACPDVNGSPQGCYAAPDCGDGACLLVASFSRDGDPCAAINGCAPGYGCRSEAMRVCRGYCGGPGKAVCAMGFTCDSLYPNVPMATIGACAP